ncbi:N-acetylmuramoyl-L-alanine amidase [Microlunatus soli]|uniref:N-acetylmuramoyl-L-alanine amidase n=1 Tax=Microlunatus soli TaxID=630515 RepID=A0A1H1X3R6_9ACTN|nr:N-acetylmuramoyl-L-alanine amidase [Microlunatus soli]
MIIIDPGHSGRSIRRTEPTTGLTDFDYPNAPEMHEVYEVSTCVADGLRDLGYRVIMTKKDADDTVGLAERARIANKAKADLAISVHNDHGQNPAFQAVYSQRGIRHGDRYRPMWRGSGSNRTVFDHPAVARASARYARVIARERGAVLAAEVDVAEENFSGRAGLEPGNLALVQLLAEVPWVYNEAGALTGGSTTRRMTRAAQTAYAEGLLQGVVSAVPGPDAGTEPASPRELRSCIDRQHKL